MSGELDSIYATLRALDQVPDEIARDVAAMLNPRMQWGERVEARVEAVAIVPGPRTGDAYLSDEWAGDVQRQAEQTLARLGGGT